ncbi:MAG: 3-dehydroquinate synthase [Candidatus Eremiobacteraeota bacterium]|nr:3-dehydroquinate synthase [Candidatus Eremiobacteraeota bacterium]MCW5870911.1 3-dehydroquinate synthase [Candidatus Eremiobacteraeota bacterium]
MIDFSSTQLDSGALAALPQVLQRLGAARWVVICDSNLERCQDLRWAPERLVVPAGEASKCLAQAEELYGQLARLEIDRKTWLVALGGGVVGDLAGFVAATYLRGLPLIQVPTSLVAQVDSSLGGKVGVDLPAGKNLVGAFYPARLVYLDPEVLDTLPAGEWNAGMAEVLKHALLDGPEHWESLENLVYPLALEARSELVLRSRQVKLGVVAADPLEQGIRAHLNLGHTLAHAIESAQQYGGWNHGQAVGFGMRAALRLSQWKLGMDPVWERRLVEQLQRYELPFRRPDLGFQELPQYLRRDKKNRDGQLRFVLLERPGAARVCSDVSLAEVERCWEELA